MANFNKVLLIGNLTNDPIAKTTQSGIKITTFSLAVSRKYKDRQGGEKEEVCFIDIETYGRVAELCNNYTKKGTCILVEGKLRMNQWTDKQTQQNRSKLFVMGESIELLARPTTQPPPANTPCPIDFPGDY